MQDEDKTGQIEAGLNTGLIITEPNPKDWVLGAGIPYEVVVPNSNWTNPKWLPDGERQRFRNFDAMACVSFATNNSIEIQINRMIDLGLIDTELIKDWLVNGKFNGSDRKLAKDSGTTVNGNALNNPAETVRKFGVCPESYWPASDDFSWNEYYKEPDARAKEKSKEFLNYFDIAYEWLSKDLVWGKGMKGFQVVQREMVNQLKQCPIIIGAATCGGWFSQDIVSACSMAANHASCVCGYENGKHFFDFDSYPEWLKKLAWNYQVPFAIKLVVKPKSLIINKNSMAKILKQENGDGYGLLLECRNPSSLMGMAEAVGKTVPGEFPANVDWAELEKRTEGVYRLN